MKTSSYVITALALSASACGLPGRSFPGAKGIVSDPRPVREISMSEGVAGDEEMRASPPERLKVPARKTSEPVEMRLANGIRAVFLERHDFPSVSAVLLLDRGAAAAGPGVAYTYSEAMIGGSSEYTSREAFEYLRFVGGRVEGFAYDDYLGMQTTALTPLFVSALSRTVPMFVAPDLGNDERENAHAEIRAARSGASDAPSTIASDAVLEMLFPAPHPYGVPIDGGAARRLENRAIDRALSPFHDQNVTTDHITVVCVGDFKPEAMAKTFEKMLAKVPRGAGAKGPSFPPLVPKAGGHVVVIDRPGAVQTNVAIAWPGPAAGSAESYPLSVLAAATAGDLSTRLNLHIRKELGATYGVRMGSYSLREAGYIEIKAAIDTGRTVEAVGRLFKELERLRTEPLAETELAAAKLRTHYHLKHGSAYGLARTLAYAIGDGLPPSYVTTFNGKIDATTAEDVRAAAERRLTKDELRVVLVGDASKIKAGVEGLGLGDVVVRR